MRAGPVRNETRMKCWENAAVGAGWRTSRRGNFRGIRKILAIV